jgi:tetratricopeptide (TPR) repeat protein
MYDIKPLEEEWEKYNKKRKRPLYIFMFIALLAIGIGTALKYSDLLPLNMDKNSSKVKIQDSDDLIDNKISKLEVHRKQVTDVKTPLNETKPVVDNNPMDPGDVFVDRDENMGKTVKDVKRPIAAEEPKTRKKIHFEMVDANTPRAYKEIESRFSFAPDPDDALFLARIYYKNGNYRKAAHWALETNKLNGNIEESWLIFARAKAKIGQKNEAIRVLSKYEKKSNSTEAKKLLKQLKK